MLAKSLTVLSLAVALVSCNKEKPAPAASETVPFHGEKVVAPVAVPAAPVVPETVPAAPTPPEEEIGVEEPMVPESEVVIGEEASAAPATPGEHLDKAIRKTGEGIQRLGNAIERKAQGH
ncbi:MAG: hypothetical protein QM680_02860 [Luteolibacter sp.]